MKNIILLIVDTLRFDRLGSSGHRPAVTPNLDAFATGGLNFPNFFSNGCVTSVAFPSLFTSTLPLDFGGYDNGIKHRPVSFPELLAENGYETYGLVTGHPCSSHFGYNRGFNKFIDLIDLYQYFRAIYTAYLGDLVTRWNETEGRDGSVLDAFAPKYRRMLHDAIRYIHGLNDISAPDNGIARDAQLKRIKRELALLESDPEFVWAKIVKFGNNYQFAFGEDELSDRLHHRLQRRSRFHDRLNKRIFLLSHRRAFEAPTVNKLFDNWIAADPKRPFFAFLHYFDLHEAKLLISKLLTRPTPKRLRDFTRAYGKIRRDREPAQRGFLYDLGLALVDENVGELRRLLDRHNLTDDTTILITGDHGTEAGHPNRGIGSYLPRMFYDEHIHVPLIINGADIQPRRDASLASHLDIPPTILGLAGINAPPSFKGRDLMSASTPPTDVVWSENGGMGQCRIGEKPVFIGRRTIEHKSIATIEGDTPVITELYDLSSDPDERTNLVGSPGVAGVQMEHLNEIKKRVDQVYEAAGQGRGSAIS